MYNDFTAAVMKALGFSRLPVEGMETRKVFGVRVWVNPLVIPNPTRWKRSTHRLMCICPLCAWDGSVGRLDQHKCSHAERNCWGCGQRLEHTTDTPYRYGGHSYCDSHCLFRSDDGEPVDFDAQDRRAAEEERLENIHRER